jgi:hypothetical protein
MSASRPELTSEHRTMFRDFVRLVHEMDQCRFTQRLREQDHTVSCAVDEDAIGPEYNWDDFRSFMTIFRKIGISESDPTFLPKIYKLMGRYASDALRERLAADRQQVMAMVYGSWSGMTVGGQIDGKDVTFPIGDVLDIVTNGMIFHESPDHRKSVEMFSMEPRWFYLWPAIHFKIMPIRNAAIMVVQIPLARSYIDPGRLSGGMAGREARVGGG